MTTHDEFAVPQPGEHWRNYKGTTYHVDHVGTATETGDPDVAYFPVDQFETYRREGPGAVEWYHRPLSSFLGSTKTPSGGHVRRFVKLPEATPPPQENSR